MGVVVQILNKGVIKEGIKLIVLYKVLFLVFLDKEDDGWSIVVVDQNGTLEDREVEEIRYIVYEVVDNLFVYVY